MINSQLLMKLNYFLIILLVTAITSLAEATASNLRGAIIDGSTTISNHDETQDRNLYETDEDDGCFDNGWCRMSVGVVLIFFTPIVIFWNEHSHARLTKLYNAAQRVVQDIAVVAAEDDTFCKRPLLCKSMDQAFVCVNGIFAGGTSLSDDLFPSIQVEDALLLKREIEILQYVQVYKGKDDGYELKEKWCTIPQPDPSRFRDKNNPVGNWPHFCGNVLLDTGYHLDGVRTEFGENIAVQRAPNPTLGSFVVPPSLMNEAFLGDRHVHRLHELARITQSQGEWTALNQEYLRSKLLVEQSGAGATTLNSSSVRRTSTTIHHVSGSYAYDGEPQTIGTIRIHWQFVKPQKFTIAAEAVAPGRPCVEGYGSMGVNLRGQTHPQKLNLMKKMIVSELFEGEGDPLLLSTPKSKQSSASALNTTTSQYWTLTPFAVTTPRILPPYDDKKFLGRLWLFAPGRITSTELFRKAHQSNNSCLWKVRAVTYLLLVGGWMLAFTGPVALVFGPNSIITSLLSLALGVVAVFLATSCWVTVSALACCTARPLRSTIIVVATVCLVSICLHGGYDPQHHQLPVS